jgi:hypothetical protein
MIPCAVRLAETFTAAASISWLALLAGRLCADDLIAGRGGSWAAATAIRTG